MDVSVVADALAVAANPESPAIAKLLLLRRSGGFVSLSDICGSAASPLDISALMSPVDAVAPPPPVRSDPHRTLARALLRRNRRAKRRQRRSAGGPGEGDGGGIDGVGDGPFGGGFGFNGGRGGGGGGGQGWNFDGFGGQSWDDTPRRRPPWGSGFAFAFVYEVIYWIALSKCIQFAFKRVARIVAETMIGDAQRREKVPARLTAVC